MYLFYNKANFYDEEFLAPCPAPKLENHPLSAVRDCLFHIFAATLHIGGRSYIHNLRICHAMVTRTPLSWTSPPIYSLNTIYKLQWLLVSAFCSGCHQTMHHLELKKTYNCLNIEWDDISFPIKETPYNHIHTQWEENSFPFKEKAYNHLNLLAPELFF